jgi:glycosyltransferase involved in cell wall biosynthesis
LGIPIVREAPSPYTRSAVARAAQAWRDLGLAVPEGHFHNPPESSLVREDREFQAVDLVLVGSPEAAETFSQAAFPVNLAVSRYGFDPRANRPRTREGRPPTAVFIGRGEPTKGIHVLLRAWSRARRPHGARLLLRAEMAPGVRALLARELDDASVVEWPHVDDVTALLSSADLMVLPSFSEGSALVSYEALGAGVVPLVSRATGSPVAHEVDGLIHETGDESELTSHLDRMLNDPQDRDRLRVNGQSTSQNWTWAAAGSRLLDLYTSLIDKGHPDTRSLHHE